MSLYRELYDAGCKLDHHESDLYVLSTPESCAIIAKHEKAHGVHLAKQWFRSDQDGKLWIDLAFMFEPFWERRA